MRVQEAWEAGKRLVDAQGIEDLAGRRLAFPLAKVRLLAPIVAAAQRVLPRPQLRRPRRRARGRCARAPGVLHQARRLRDRPRREGDSPRRHQRAGLRGGADRGDRRGRAQSSGATRFVTCSATPSSTTSPRATSRSGTASGSRASRWTRSARWARCWSPPTNPRSAGPRHLAARQRAGAPVQPHVQDDLPGGQCIEVLSQGLTLRPATSSRPAARRVGAATGNFLKAGDRMEAEVERIGVLANRVAAP